MSVLDKYKVDWPKLRPAERGDGPNPLAARMSTLRRSMRLGTMAAVKMLCRAFLPQCDPETVPYESLTKAHLFEFYEYVYAEKSSRTAEAYYTYLRAVVGVCVELGLMDSLAFDMTAVRLKPVVGVRQKRVVSPKEARLFFKSCFADADSALGRRDALLFGIMWFGGCRLNEACSVRLENIHRDKNRIFIQKAKGGRSYLVFPNAELWWLIDQWLEVRPRERRGFLLGTVGRNAFEPGLSQNSGAWAINSRIKKAGLARFTSHDLRRSFASRQLDAGADLHDVSPLMGHSDIKTTARYDLTQERRMQAICDKDLLGLDTTEQEQEQPNCPPPSTNDLLNSLTSYALQPQCWN